MKWSKCLCGCGRKVKPRNKYVDGHNRRGKKGDEKTVFKKGHKTWNKGKTRSKKTRIKISKTLTGKTRPESSVFTKREIEKIKKEYPFKGTRLAHEIGKGKRSIKHKARELGVRCMTRVHDKTNRLPRGEKREHFATKIMECGLEDLFESCCICGWDTSVVDWAHYISRKNNGKYVIGNVIPLCPNHHRLFDHKKLNKEEKNKMEKFRKYSRKEAKDARFKTN